MALIPCPECGKQVSSKAATCPKCGIQISKTVDAKSGVKTIRAGAKWEFIGFLLISIGIVMAIADSSGWGGALIVSGFVVFIIGRFL